jgi:hypothetical protein
MREESKMEDADATRYDIFDSMENVTITEQTREDIRDFGLQGTARDLAEGDVVSVLALTYEPGQQRGNCVILHNHGRAYLTLGGDPEWGDWDEQAKIIRMDGGTIYDVYPDCILEQDED